MSDQMKCPFCGRKKCVHPSGDRAFFCGHCKVTFEPDDEGDYHDRAPTRRLERREQHAQRVRRGPR